MEELRPLPKPVLDQYQAFARERLGFEYHDITLLVTALTHRSYINEHQLLDLHHNERLEFLGDAVLELVVSDYLYHTFDEPEGIMTSWRSALVRTEAIGAAGRELGYAPLVRLSKGESQGSDRSHDVIYADCFEAVIGSIYLDQGYEAAKNFIYQHIIRGKLEQILREESWRDAKSYFQELAQKAVGITPQYRTIKEEGPDHNKTFTVGAYVSGHLRGTGVGHSKQEAETAAAREGIKFYLPLVEPDHDRDLEALLKRIK